MTDKTDQFTEMQRAWVAQQQQLLNDWLGSLKTSQPDSLRANWRKAADVMAQQVESALQAQEKSLMNSVANLEGIEGVPEAVATHVEQLKTTIGSWADVQRDIWKVWFDMLREAAPAAKTPADAMVESWEELAKRTMDIQKKWLSG